MIDKETNSNGDKEQEPKVYGNPIYGAKDDIYNNEEKVELDDSDDDGVIDADGINNPLTGDGLDVPGAELDDTDELIGEEDEENNYYSLGGDNHEDLSEDQGD